MKPSGKHQPLFHSSEHRLNSSRAFTVGADTYDAVRPSYPDSVVELLAGRGVVRTVLDVGSGTGIFAAQLHAAGHRVACCEPSPDMANTLRARHPELPVWRATAECTASAPKLFDAITFAQAWHWVDPHLASAEAARISKDDGELLLCWNTLEVEHPWVLRLAKIMHSGDVLTKGFYPTVFEPWHLKRELRTTWIQPIRTDQLFTLMATRSYWLRANQRTRDKMTDNLTWYLHERLGFDPGQLIPLPYRTDAFLYGRR